MELELGLKVTRTREDVSSSVDFRFSKDPFGPLVLSRETDSRFIIIIHLKGFKKEGIEIEINKEGDRITVRGRKPVEEMVMIRWMAWKKEVEIRAFRKVFLIPYVVDLDKIKARFDDDDATLTITMPKRVKGISGFKIEEEEEEEEERVDFGDVSEVENRDEMHNGEEEFGEIMEDKERESQVLGEEEKGFSGGLDEEETQIEDDGLEKIQQVDEQDKILEFVEEERIGQQELDDSNTGSEDSNLRKLPGTEEQENNQEVMEQQDSQVETISDDLGSRAFEDIEEQVPDEQLDITSKSREMEKKTTDDDGLSNVQGIEEPERGNGESKIQEMVKGETCDHEKEKNENVKRESKTDAKEDVDGKIRQGNIERTQEVVGENEIAETETEAEEIESDEGDKSEDMSLKKLQENEEQHSKGQRRQEKTLEAETNIGNDILEVPEVDTFGDEGKKEKEKKIIKNGDAKEEVDAKMGERFTPNISETETKAAELESVKLKAEVDKIQELVEKKEEEEENANVGTQSEDISLTKLQEDTEELEFQGQKQHEKQEEIKEQTPEAEKNVANDTLKPIQERCEGKQKIEKLCQEEKKNQPEEYKEKIMETGKKIDDGGARKVQEIIRQQELDEPAARCEEASKTRELVKSKTNDEERKEKEIAETETEEQESYRPKILREREKIQETADEEKSFSKNGKVKEKEEISEKKTEFGDERKVLDSDAKEEVDEEMGEGFTPNIAETETKAEEIVSDKTESGDVDKIHEMVEKKEEEKGNAKVRTQSEDSSSIKELQETEEKDSYRPKILGEQDKIQELAEEKKNFSRKIKEDEETAEKKTEFGEDDVARKVGDNDQQDSDAMKGQEEKLSDGGKGIIAVAETIDDNDDRSTKVQEIEEQQSHEEEIYRKQFQKLTDHGEVKDVEKEKKTKEAEKSIIGDSAREAQKIERKDSDVSGKYVKGDRIQELQENREAFRNEKEEEKKDKGDDRLENITGTTEQELVKQSSQLRQANIEEGEKTQELVEEKVKDCKEEESKSKTNDDVARKVQGIKEQELDEPKREHVSMIKEVVEEKIAESEIEAECSGLSKLHGREQQELHEANIHKERDKTKPSGQEKEEEDKDKIVASKKITKHDNSTDVQEMKEERPDKPESHEQRYKIQEEKVNVEAKLETEDSSKKVQDIQKQEHDELKKSIIQDKMQETEEKAKDGSLKKVGDDDEDLEMSEPNKRREKDKIQEPVEMGTSGYREKAKKQDGDEILRSQEEVEKPDLEEFERLGGQRNISQLVEEEEKVENIADPGGELAGDHSGKFNEFEEGKSYDDWSHKELEKRQKIVKMEATDPKDRHTGVEEEEAKKVKEIEKQESMVQDKMQETEEKDKTRAMEENEIVERRTKANDGSLRKVRQGKDPEMGRQKRHGEEDISDDRETVKRKNEDDIFRSQETDKLDLGEVEKHCKERKIHYTVEDEKVEGKMEKISEPGGEMEGEFQKQKSYEDWRKDGSEEIKDLFQEEVTDPKDKHTGGKRKHEEERYEKVAQAKTKVEDEINKKVEKKEQSESDKQDFVEDERGDQEDDKAEEAAAEVANNEKDSSRNLHSMRKQELREPENEQNKIPKTSDPQVKEEYEKRVAEKETKDQEAHAQELEGKSENYKEKRREKGKQGKNVETVSSEIERKTQKTRRMQETNEKKNQEAEDKIEELEREETSNHEAKLVTEDDSLSKGQELLEKELSNKSKRRPVEQEKFQELKEYEEKINDDNSRIFEMLELQGLDEAEENEDQTKIQKPVEEEKTNAPEMEKEGNEIIAEEVMQDTVDSRTKDQKMRRQEPYELLKNGDHERIPEKGMEEKETKEMITHTLSEDVSSRKVQQIKDELKKPQKPSEISEKHKIQESVEEMNEGGEYKAVLKTRSMDSSQSQEVEENGSDEPKRYAEQELLLAEEKRKKENVTREKGGQKEKAKRITQVESKAKDDTVKENETEGHESTGLRERKETSDKRKEEKEEEVVGKAETVDEYDSSRKIQEREERKSDNLERHGEEEMSGKLAEEETSDDKEAKEKNRAGVNEMENQELAIQVRHRERDKKQSFLEKDTSGKEKENKTQETKSSSSTKTQENEKQDKRNQEEDGKGDKEIAEAEMPRKLKEIEDLVENKIKDQEEDDKKSMITEVLAKSEEHESIGPEGEDKSREQRLKDNLRGEESAKTETKGKDNESRKIHQIKEQETSEQERRKEQGTIKELVEDRTPYFGEKEFEDGSSKKIPETDKEESTKPGRDEKRDKIQEPVDRETSEDDEEELEVEYEESEEEWEAEVIQEMDSDEDHDKIRQIRRFKLGFRLVGGSTLFMSLIVIVISFIRSKRKIRCYKY